MTASAGRCGGNKLAGVTNVCRSAASRSGPTRRPCCVTSLDRDAVVSHLSFIDISTLLIKLAASLNRRRCPFFSHHLCIRRFIFKIQIDSKFLRGADSKCFQIVQHEEKFQPRFSCWNLSSNENNKNVSHNSVVCLFISQLSRCRCTADSVRINKLTIPHISATSIVALRKKQTNKQNKNLKCLLFWIQCFVPVYAAFNCKNPALVRPLMHKRCRLNSQCCYCVGTRKRQSNKRMNLWHAEPDTHFHSVAKGENSADTPWVECFVFVFYFRVFFQRRLFL